MKNQAGLLEMQQFVQSIYEPLLPSAAHLQIPRYKWKAIITTNYDLAIERAYDQCENSTVKLRPIISDDDNIGPILASPATAVPLLKLHGCVTRANDKELPLILSSGEYSRYRHRRARLFNYLKEWGHDYPIIFCGYSIADENVRDILFDLVDGSVQHKRFVLCNPDLIPAEISMWAERRIDAIPGTFADLMSYLENALPDNKLVLASIYQGESGPLSKFIASRAAPTTELAEYLSKQLIQIHPDMAVGNVVAADFYRGLSDGFSWLPQSLDVDRSVTEELTINTVLSEKNDRKPELHVLLGYAGSGKSVVLKRLAWDMASTYGKPVFYLNERAQLSWDHISELYELISEPIYLIVDDAIEAQSETEQCLRLAKKNQIPIVIICGARTNEWNVEASDLSALATETYELLDLSNIEVKSLVNKLKASNCLGYMANFSDIDAQKYLKAKLDNQLLVALHEATSGRPFADIVSNEYTQLVPNEAQRLYLDICTVHRVGVPVRAGTISRVSGIRLEDFHDRLFRPLEHVVHTSFSAPLGDYVYKTRHPNIAGLVFDNAVPTEEAKSAQLVRIIQSLNTGYSSDNEAVTKLIRSKTLSQEFTDKSLVYPIFKAAREAGVSDEVVDQHLAQFESIHKNGDVRKALHLVEQAIGSSRNGRPAKSTLHVKATILKRLAKDAKSVIERDKYRQEAKAILDRLIADKRDPHPFVVKADLLIDELVERLNNTEEDGNNRIVTDILRDVQSVISQCRQHFSRDAYSSTVESRLANTMNEHPRATSILEQAHRSDKQTPFLAIRLAERYQAENRSPEAIRVLSETLKAGGPNKDVHLAMAECFRSISESDKSTEISDHLRRSFSIGDSRYRAQFLHARHEFLFGDKAKARESFERLQAARLSPKNREEATDPVTAPGGSLRRYTGSVERVKPSFSFIRVTDLGAEVYLSKRQFRGDWEVLRRGIAIQMHIAFSFRGAVAIDAQTI
ncbi:SIR2 family protein [Xanthomonas oryzae]|uniref:P-loop NTPase n=1 Tax=Xanthomonas oryzae TaxID=347 RepID=UPI0034672F0D